MKKIFVSNSTRSARMFKCDLLESLPKVHDSVLLFVGGYALWVINLNILVFVGWWLFGLLVWMITSMMLRFVFHFKAKSILGKSIHFIFQGMHHDYPKDAKRLVMPPSTRITMAPVFYIFYFKGFWLLEPSTLFSLASWVGI